MCEVCLASSCVARCPNAPEPPVPVCPVCGEEAEGFYRYGWHEDVIGCNMCLIKMDAFEALGYIEGMEKNGE